MRISPAFVASEFLESSGGLAICTALFLGESFGSAAVRLLGANPSKQTHWQEALCPLLTMAGHFLA